MWNHRSMPWRMYQTSKQQSTILFRNRNTLWKLTWITLMTCSCNNIVSRFIMPGSKLEVISRTVWFSIERKVNLLSMTSPMPVASHYVTFAIAQPLSSITTQVKPHDHLQKGWKRNHLTLSVIMCDYSLR